MAAMMLPMTMTLTACGDDNEGNGTTTPPPGPQYAKYVEVTYMAKATDMAGIKAVTDTAYVRYLDADNSIKQEGFTGEWSRTVRMTVSQDTTYAAALQVIGVPRDSASLSVLQQDVNLHVNITSSARFIFEDGTSKPATLSAQDAINNNNIALPDLFQMFYRLIKSDTQRYGGLSFANYSYSGKKNSISSNSELWTDNKLK